MSYFPADPYLQCKFYIHHLHSCWCIWVGSVVMFFFPEKIPLLRFQGSIVTFQGIVLVFRVWDGAIIDVCCSGLSVSFLGGLYVHLLQEFGKVSAFK